MVQSIKSSAFLDLIIETRHSGYALARQEFPRETFSEVDRIDQRSQLSNKDYSNAGVPRPFSIYYVPEC
jgi:hypothetical protein